MSALDQFRRQLQERLPQLRQQYGIDTLSLFGSYVRGENEVGSDLDVLVTFRTVPGLLRFVEIEQSLSDLLGVKVDLVMKDALKPRIREQVLRELVPI